MVEALDLAYWIDDELPRGSGSLGLSNWEACEVPPFLPAPGFAAPTGCTAVCWTNSGCVQINWVDTNGGSVAYEVRVSIDGGGYALVGTTAAGATQYSYCGIDNILRNYVFRVSPVGDDTLYCETSSPCMCRSALGEYFSYFTPQSWTDTSAEASYSVLIRNTDGDSLAIIDAYQYLEYKRMLNDQGLYTLTAATDLIDTDHFQVDRIVEIWRAPQGYPWREDFTAFHRYKKYEFDQSDMEFMVSTGPGLESLLKRRIIVPPSGEAFLTIDDQLTDMMRELVRTQCTALAEDPDRVMPGLSVEADSGEGIELRLNFRHTNLLEDLKLLAQLGADFGLLHSDDAEFQFSAFYPQRGLDRLIGNTDGNNPVVFSLEMGNMASPSIELDRLTEFTIAYVAGEGVGARREIVERQSLEGDEYDSPWNRVEAFLEASQEFTTGSLMALGDGFLAENKKKITFSCEAIQLPVCLYGVHWDLGDLVTGYYRDIEYDLQVKEVHVKVTESGETISPTFEVKAFRVGSDYVYWDTI